MNKAIYAGSFDPWTYGHWDILRQAINLFDEIEIVVAHNPDKKRIIHPTDAVHLIRKSVGYPNVKVTEMSGSFLADYAVKQKANYLIRGIRNSSDLEYERTVQHINDIRGGGDLETVYFRSTQKHELTSSSMVRSLIGPVGWRDLVGEFVDRHQLGGLETYHAGRLFDQMHGSGSVLVRDYRHIKSTMLASWNSEGRFYHTVSHLLDCLELCQEVGDQLNRRVNVEVALWFHDIVYKPLAKDNEEESVRLFDALIMCPSQDIKEMILATRDHQIPADWSAERQHDAAFMLDIDMAILGSNPIKYQAYATAVKREYIEAGVSELVYREGRRHFLEGLLAREHIFHTQHFRDTRGEQARYNIEEELWLNRSLDG